MSDTPASNGAHKAPFSHDALQLQLQNAQQTLASGNVTAAIEQARHVLNLVAHQHSQKDELYTQAQYLLAVSQRYGGDLAAAHGTLADLLQREPRNARGWQEQGHLDLKRGEHKAAIRAFDNAVTLNPALIGSWRALIQLRRDDADHEGADHAQERVQTLTALPKELLAAMSFLHEDKLYKAEQICRDFLRQNVKHVEGMRLLADIGVRLSVYDDAEFLLDSAVAFAPEHELARSDYVNILIRRQKFARALEALQPLLEKRPSHTPWQIAKAMALVGLGRHDEGIALYQDILSAGITQPQLHVSLGHAYKTVGQLPQAIERYQQAYRVRSNFGDAYWSLANTKTYRFSDSELEAIRAEEERPETPIEDRIHLCFAAGKALEDAQRYEQSFNYYDKGNRLKRDEVRYAMEQTNARIEALKTVATTELFTSEEGHPAADPIFVVGLPRAGSTLLEQILASHSQIDGTLELPTMLGIAQRLRGRSSVRSDRYPKILNELTPEQRYDLGKHYLDETAVYRQGAPFFIDKMPNNFFHVALIRLILPNAKIIDARRHPMSCCFSGFKQLFGEGQEFTYGLAEIGHYYRRYVELMDHWDEVLPGYVLRVQHEAVVDDLEGQVRRMLDFCNVPFEQSCVEYHRTERSVRTPSSEQVRQPIFRDSLEQWKAFEPWLDPLKTALGEEVLARFATT